MVLPVATVCLRGREMVLPVATVCLRGREMVLPVATVCLRIARMHLRIEEEQLRVAEARLLRRGGASPRWRDGPPRPGGASPRRGGGCLRRGGASPHRGAASTGIGRRVSRPRSDTSVAQTRRPARRRSIPASHAPVSAPSRMRRAPSARRRIRRRGRSVIDGQPRGDPRVCALDRHAEAYLRARHGLRRGGGTQVRQGRHRRRGEHRRPRREVAAPLDEDERPARTYLGTRAKVALSYVRCSRSNATAVP